MSKIYVYLAGGIAHNSYGEATLWRDAATDALAKAGIIALNPMRGKTAKHWQDGEANHDHPGFSAEDVFERDLKDIRKSHAIIVNLHTAKSVGTPFEMGYAYSLKIPLFIACPKELHTHPFIRESAYSLLSEDVDTAVSSCIDYLAVL